MLSDFVTDVELKLYWHLVLSFFLIGSQRDTVYSPIPVKGQLDSVQPGQSLTLGS